MSTFWRRALDWLAHRIIVGAHWGECGLRCHIGHRLCEIARNEDDPA